MLHAALRLRYSEYSPMSEDLHIRIPLTSLQKEAWLAHETLPDDHPGISFLAQFVLTAWPDVAVLRAALRSCIRHYPLLGATLEKGDAGMPVFVTGAYLEPDLLEEDLSTATDPEAALEAFLTEFQKRPFTPFGGPLIHFTLVRVAPRRACFCVKYFHLVGDGLNSLAHFAVLSRCYAAIKAGREPDLGEAASWQAVVDADARYALSSRAERDRAFWAEQVCRLPEERFFQPLAGRPDVPGEIFMAEHCFSAVGMARLETLAQRHGMAMSTLLATVYGVTLALLYDVPRVVFQMPVNVGERKDELHMQGYNISLTPLVVEATPQATFAAVAKAVRQECRLLQLHAKTCVQAGMRAQGRLAGMGHLWDANLNFFATEMQTAHPDLQLDAATPYSPRNCRQDQQILGMYVLPASKGTSLRCIFGYSRNYFTAADVRRFMARMELLVALAEEDGDRPLSSCSLLLDEERRQLMQWEQGAVCPQPYANIPAQFDAAASAHAQAPACCGEDGSVRTYAQVRAAAGRLARRLRAAGVRRGDVVAVLARRHAALPETVLGVMAAGAVYLPVDPEYPAERVHYMLEDSAARVALALCKEDAALEAVAKVAVTVLLTGDAAEECPPAGAAAFTAAPPCVHTGADMAGGEGADGDTWYLPVRGEEPAYLIYTSGSTGQPKGVVVPHRAFANMIQGQISLFGIGPEDHVLQFASPSFDASLSEIFMALMCGAALYPVSPELILAPWDLHAYMTRHAVSVVTFPPSYLALFQHQDFPSLRVMLTAGEAPVAEDVRYYAEKLRYFNAYGPTEAAVCATAAQLTPQTFHSTVGCPLPNTGVHVLDSRGQRAVPGIAGELWLSGAGLALGYLHRPEVTGAAFRAPAGLPETRCYRTGDRARWLPDGTLMLMGRADDQVKVRGHRIELGELTTAVEACDGVAQAAVLVVGANGGKTLAAFVQPRTGAACTAETVSASLRRRLPRYMVPSLLHIVARLPLSPTGKVDKKRLAEQALTLLDSAVSVAHLTEREAQVAAQYAAVLGHDVTDPCRSFFSMGGDSLKGAALLHLLEINCGCSLPMREFFKDSSVRAVAAAVRPTPRQPEAAQRSTAQGAAAENAGRSADGGAVEQHGQMPIPLHAGQLAMWAQECLHSDSVRYIMPLAMEFHGTAAEAHRLANAVRAALAVQPLCTAVVGGDIDAPVFLPFAAAPACVEEDLRGPDKALTAEAQASALDIRIHTPFDVTKTPPARLHLLRVGEDRWILLINLHHMIADGTSLSTVLRDAAVLYAGGTLPALPRAEWLRTFAAAEAAYLASAEAREDVVFWRDALRAVPPCGNPAGGARTALSGEGRQLLCPLPAESVTGLHRLAAAGDTSLLGCMLGLLGEFLRQRMGVDTVLVAVPTGTRDTAGLQQVCGYFVNPVPVVLTSAGTLEDTVRQAGEHLRQAAAHNRYPAYMLPEVLGQTRHDSLTDILLTHMDTALQPLPELAALMPRPVLTPLRSAKTGFAFCMVTGEADAALLMLEYDDARADSGQAQALLHAWEAFVCQAVAGVLPAVERLEGCAPAAEACASKMQDGLRGNKGQGTQAASCTTCEECPHGASVQRAAESAACGNDYAAVPAASGSAEDAASAAGGSVVHSSAGGCADGIVPCDGAGQVQGSAAAQDSALAAADAALSHAWGQTLGCAAEEDSDFFLLGGDSIKVIQLIGRLRRAGITSLTPAHCFAHPTLGALRACLHTLMNAGGAREEAASAWATPAPDEALPLLPLQARWVTRHPNTWRTFHMGMALQLSAAVDAARLQAGFLALGTRHEALRLRFTEQNAHCSAADSAAGLWLTLDCTAEQTCASCFAAASRQLFPRLDCTAGPVYGGVLITRGAERYFLLGAHHFAVDAVSLDMLRADLAAFCQDGAWTSPAPACGAAAWAQAVARHGVFADAAAEAAEVAFWKGVQLEQGGTLNALRPAGADTMALRRQVRVQAAYDTADTHARADMLAALAAALGLVRQKDPVLVTLEGHGREPLLSGVDISQTVGWFTAAYPLLVRPAGQETAAHDVMRASSTVSGLLPAMPAHGARYGFAAACHAEVDCAAQISLNYLGTLPTAVCAVSPLTGTAAPAALTLLPELSTAAALPMMLDAAFTPEHPLDVLAFGTGGTAGKSGTLTLEASFSPERLPVDWVETLLRTWAEVLSRVQRVRLAEAEDVREMLAKACQCRPEDVAEVGEPDPAQEAMLFQYLLDAEAGNAARYYTQQMWFTLRGEVDADALEQAWTALAARHEVLRTLFPRTRTGEFRRVVLKKARLDTARYDFSGLPYRRQLARRDAVLEQCRAEGFDLAGGPLLLLQLFRRTDEAGEICWDMAWCFTHLLMDGWCIGIMLRELFSLYVAAHTGAAAALPAAPSLAAYRLALAGQDERALRTYWRTYLQQSPALLPLAGPETATPEVLEQTLRVPDSTALALRALAGRCSATLPLLLQSAWALLLGQGGQQDVTFGLVVSGRPASVPEVEQMLGLFIRTLPVRVRWTAALPFTALVTALRQDAAARAPHELDALADIQRCREGGGALFDHLLVFENYPLDGIAVAGAPQVMTVGGWERQPYALAVSVLPHDGLAFRFTYDVSRLPAPRLHSLCAAWLCLLDRLAASTADSLTCGDLVASLNGAEDGATAARGTDEELSSPSLSLRPETAVQEADARLCRFAGMTTPYARDASVPQLFAEMARQMPLASACIGADGDLWTYEELATAAARVASALHGLRAGEPVALAMPRRPEAVAAMLGVMAAGGCFLPLDERMPQTRTRQMLDIAGCHRILFWDAEPAWLAAESVSGRELLGYSACMAGLPHFETAPVAAEQPAYIMFTSGTTGVPKAVQVPHRGIVRLVRNTNYLHMRAGECMLQAGTFCFDASTLELWAPLLNGGTVCFADTESLLSPQRLRALLAERHIDMAWFTASLFSVLAAVTPDIFSTLRALYTGGEPMNTVAAASVLQACPQLELYNGYGPTENTTFTAVHRVTPQDVREGAVSVPLGRPVANTRVYILGAGGRLAAVGEWGEICAAGDGLALGYLGNAEATARAFEELPPPVGERVYHTGDIGRWREDGCLEFQGRRDGQVKIRGYRVELSEVETALTRLPAVQEAAVLAQGEGEDKRLMAFVTLAQEVSPQVVRRMLQEVLPAYMVPARIAVLKSLPVTVNGKRDKAALLAVLEQQKSVQRGDAAPDATAVLEGTEEHGAAGAARTTASGSATDTAGERASGNAAVTAAAFAGADNAAASGPVRAPMSDVVLARALADIFAEVLKIPVTAIKGDADFFLLGGQSLKAIRLQMYLNSRFGCTLSIREVMDNGHISALTARIQQQLSGGTAQTAQPLPSPEAVKVMDYPLTPAQEQMWFLQRMHPESGVYNVVMACALDGDVREDVLQQTLLELENRHEGLRLRLPAVAEGQTLHQRVAQAGALTLEIQDCRTAPQPEAAAAAVVRAWQQRPFIFGEDQPLVRAGLVRISAASSVLVIILHHSICDGWSVSVLLRDMHTVYSALLRGEKLNWPAAPLRFVDYVQQLRRRLVSPEGKAMLERQAARLTPMPEPLRLPADFPRAAVQTFDGDVVVSHMSAADMNALRALGRQCEVSLFPVLLSLLGVLLYRHTGQTDMVLGLPAACRSTAEMQDVVGLFFNVLPLRLRLDASEDFSACVRQTACTVRDVLDDQECPAEEIIERLALPRRSTRSPLYDVLVGYEEETWSRFPEDSLLRMHHYPISGVQSRLDLSVFLREQPDGSLDIHWEFSTGLFERATIERISARFAMLARAVCTGAAQSLAHLPLLPQEELAQLAAFTETAEDWDLSGGMYRCFAAQAARSPEAAALRCDDGSVVTYRQFAGQVGRMAAWLRAQGVAAGMPVGVCFARGAALMTALFAVQCCGAFYVPLTPQLPQERVRSMLEDVPPQATVLTDEEHAEALRGAVATPALAERGTRVLVVDWAAMQTLHPCAPAEPAPDALAYILFTSGSTGRPKGVMVEERGVLNRLFWMQSRFPLGAQDVILQKTPISFDVSVWELFWWAWQGAALALLAPGAEGNPEALTDAVARHHVTTMHFVPSMLRTFLEYVDHHPEALSRLASLRRVFASGEALTLDCVRLFNRLLYATHGTELHNLYGPTEATVDVTWQPCSPLPDNALRVPIGRPVSNTEITVRDASGELAPLGVLGEIVISGVQVARGYSNRPEQTAAAFDVDAVTGARRYHTGDLGRWLPAGALEYWGRRDNQMKIRGFRIELSEVEAALEECPAVAQAVARVGSMGGLPALEAYLLPVQGARLTLDVLRAALGRRLPEYMYPSAFFIMDAAPLNANGKADRKALRGTRLMQEQGQPAAAPAAADADTLLAAVRDIWHHVLPEAGDIPPDTGFFDAGGTSLLLVRLYDMLNTRWPGLFSLPDLFVESTMRRQVAYITGSACTQEAPVLARPAASGAVAIIGMAVRLADYDTLDAFWTDLFTGADRLRPLPAARRQDQCALLAALGIAPQAMDFCDALYLDDIAGFDCRRFSMAPADARVMDPEQRLFFATALHALEDAGYGGTALDGKPVGVFVGGSPSSLFKQAVLRSFPAQAEQAFMLNVPSAVATRLSYLHDWQGPAALVDTACSSGLTAVQAACAAVRRGECTVALAGAVRVQLSALRQGAGFAIASSTGHTRAFDAAADGTNAGEGAVAFLLKPLERALADGDAIRAVLLGGACNQDGHSAGVAAPNPAAQAAVLRAAAQEAAVPLTSLSFMEAHGTGTVLGDPIEIDGLTRAFGGADGVSRPLGSAKGNFGHLDAAAGALGMAKAVLCLQRGQVPRQPHFTTPNPRIDFAHAPVHVAAETEQLGPQARPWRCGVSAFGLSGINAHVILQEAPERVFPPEVAGWCCIPLSAADAAGVRRYGEALLARLEEHPEYPLHAVAATLSSGREHLACRAAFVVQHTEALRAALTRWLLAGAPASLLAAARQETVQMDIFTEEAAACAAMRQFMAGAAPAYTASARVPVCRVHLPFPPLCTEHCWPAFAVQDAARATLLTEGVELPQGWSFALPVRDAAFWPVAEHCVAGVPTLVGMATPALLGDALRRLQPDRTAVLQSFRWLRPVQTETTEAASLLLTAEEAGKGEETGGKLWHAALVARDAQGTWTPCVEARVHSEDVSLPAPLDVKTLHEGMRRVREAQGRPVLSPSTEHTAEITAAGHAGALVESAKTVEDSTGEAALVQVSERWHCRRQMWRSADGLSAAALLELPERYQQDAHMTAFHPALLDAAVSLCLTENRLPAACDCIHLYAPLPARVWVRTTVRPSAAPQSAGHARGQVVDCVIADEQGRVLVTFEGLTFVTPPSAEPRLHLLEWTPVRLSSAAALAGKAADMGVTAGAAKVDGPVALLGQGTLCDALAEAWERQGMTVMRCAVPQDEAACTALAQQWRQSRIRTLCHILPEMPASLAGDDSPEAASAAAMTERRFAWQGAALVQAVLRAGLTAPLRWLCLGRTDGAQAVPAHALSLGMLLAAQEEDAHLHACFVDMPVLTAPEEEPAASLISADAVMDNLAHTGTLAPTGASADNRTSVSTHAAGSVSADTSAGSLSLAVRGLTELLPQDAPCGWLRLDSKGGIFRPVLSAPLTAPAEACPAGDAAHCVLVSGGLGGMGLTLAAGLAPRLGGSIALVHRGTFPEESAWPALALGKDARMAARAAALLALRRASIPFRLYSCDICDAAALAATLARVRRELGPVGAVLHTAGVAGDGFLLNKDARTFDAVLAPKVTGVRVLHALTRQDPVRFFILASSRTGLTGAAGQTDYTAANAYLDAFARWRAAQGLPVLSLAWNTWADTGMAARKGVRTPFSLKPEDALPTVFRALGTGAAQLAVSLRGESLSRPAAEAPEASLTGGLQGRTVTEYVVAVVEQVLGYEGRLTPQDDFYALGGDSLSGSRVVNVINTALSVSVGLADILADGRLSSFAACVERARQRGAQAAGQAPVRETYPVSREQSAVLRAVAAAEPHTGYNLPQFIPLPDTADTAGLEQAVSTLIARHEVLRTRFVDVQTPEPQMRVLPAAPFVLEEKSFPTLAAAATALVQPFIMDGPLFRAALITLPAAAAGAATEAGTGINTGVNAKASTGVAVNGGTGVPAHTGAAANLGTDANAGTGAALNAVRRLLFMDVHHALADAHAVGILLAELSALLAGRTLPPAPLQQKDAAWAEQEEDPQQLAQARAYWLAHFANPLPRLELPADFPRPAWHSHRGAACSVLVPAAVVRVLQAMASAQGATLNNVFFAAWAVLLAGKAQTDDIVIAMAADGREAAFAQTAGMFAALLPVRLSLRGGVFAEVLQQSRQRQAEALRFKAFPLGSLLAALKPPVALDRTVLAEVQYSFMNYGRPAAGALTPVVLPVTACKADLAIFGSETDGGVFFALEYYADLFSAARMEALGQEFLALVTRLAAQGPQLELADLRAAPEAAPADEAAASAGHLAASSASAAEGNTGRTAFTDHSAPRTAAPDEVTQSGTVGKMRSAAVGASAVPAVASADAVAVPAGAAAAAFPAAEMEALVLAIFRTFFEDETLGLDDNFFDWGGHSLLAMQIVNALNVRLGLTLTVRALFTHPEARTLAAYVRSLDAVHAPEARTTAAIPALPARADGLYPLSHAQQRLYVLQQTEGGAEAYSMLFLLRCAWPLEETRLRRALSLLLRRHEVLRTSFMLHHGELRQQVHTEVPVPCVFHPAAASDKEACLRTLHEAMQPFALDSVPLLRVSACPAPDGGMYVAFGMHHIIGDGWSLQIFFGELMRLYRDSTAALPPLPVQYRDYACWQQGRDWTEAAAYWRGRLKNVPEHIALPADAMPAAGPHPAGVVSRVLPAAVLAQVRAYAAGERVSLATCLLTLFAALLRRLSRQSDMLIGMGVAGRERKELEGLIGFFVNILPIRITFQTDEEFRDCLHRVEAACTEALARQDYPFDLLVRECAPASGAERGRQLLNIMFEYQRYSDVRGINTLQEQQETQASRSIPPEEWMPLTGMQGPAAKYALTLFVQDEPQGCRLRAEYDSALFTGAAVEQWLATLEKLIDRVSARSAHEA